MISERMRELDENEVVDKYYLLQLLEKFVQEDEQCSQFCEDCKYIEPCEKLSSLADVIMQD